MLLFGLMFVLVANPANATSEEWQVEKITWNAPIGEGMTIQIENEYGDIRARGTKDRVVALSAMIQTRRDDPDKISFDIKQTDDRVVIKVIYTGDDRGTIRGKNTGKRRGDVTVYIPSNVVFKARTEDGLLEAKGIKGAVDLESMGGRIFCRVDGDAKVKTHQGNVLAVLKSTNWTKPPIFESTLGTLEVQLPPDSSVNVEASTRGEISTDYSLTMEHESTGMKRALITGKNDQMVVISNKTGNIKIHKGKWDPSK